MKLFLHILLAIFAVANAHAEFPKKTNDAPAQTWWSLKPVARPSVPKTSSTSTNPIDQFLAARYKTEGLTPAPPASKRTLLRRLYLDLIGIPPSPSEQDDFLNDTSPDAYEKVVDRLLASEQHGVRYARHWLDVLRYADADERMTAAAGIYLWRDWVIQALNDDAPYDQFVRAQLTGYRTTERTQMSATGYRSKKEIRPDDLFALGFLARGAGETGDLALNAVDTVSTAFMGMTVGCAKCHDHMYDPISERDYYSMKALFDPLVLRKVTLASAAELIASSKTQAEIESKRVGIQSEIDKVAGPYKSKLFEDRLLMLPADVQSVIRKPEKQRTIDEQKIADDYFPILRIDSDKISEVMPEADRKKYQDLQKDLNSVTEEGGRRAPRLPVFYAVEVDHAKELEKSYVLTSGDPARPEKNKEVQPGWPFAPEKIDLREGRIEAFSDWLTSSENPLFARVAVNRLWQWHFGEGLQKLSSDFGELGGKPSHPELLDWLASEFLRLGCSMKKMHKLMLMSDAYKLASEVSTDLAAANTKIDPANTNLWHFRLQRLEAEPIWDSMLTAAGNLDLAVGGPSFDLRPAEPRRGNNPNHRNAPPRSNNTNRRAAYITRGYSTSRDVMAAFLQAFDVDDGRAPCPMRTQTVTAPQALFLMNSPEVDRASTQFAERLLKDAGGDLSKAIDLGYQFTVARPPTEKEKEYARTTLESNAEHLKKLAWLLFNLDEFIYLP